MLELWCSPSRVMGWGDRRSRDVSSDVIPSRKVMQSGECVYGVGWEAAKDTLRNDDEGGREIRHRDTVMSS